MTDFRRLIAVHEAGHAIARYLRGLAIDPAGYVSIITTPDGHVRGATNLGYVGAPLDDMVITAAGMVAEARLESEQRPEIITIGEFGIRDSWKLLDLAAMWNEQHPEDGNTIELYEDARDQAWELLTAPDAWAAVLRIADRLLIEGSIDGQDVLLEINQEVVGRT